jgi:hypothetical protein
MDRTEILGNRSRRCSTSGIHALVPSSALALLLLVAATCAVAQSSRGNREERALRKSNPIYLELDERRVVDRTLVERIRCRQGVVIVRWFGRTALVYCELHARPSPPLRL